MLTTSSISSRNHETSSQILRFVSIVRDNVHQTFSNFYHSLHIRYHDISTSFMIFGLHLLFIEFKNTSHVKFAVMFRKQDVWNFGSVPGYGLTLYSVTWLSFFESLNSIIRITCSSNLAHFSVVLIYFFNLFHLIEFFWISQIWTASHSNNGKIEWKNDIHVIESNVRPYPGTDQKFWTSCSWNMTTNLRTNCF